MGLAVFPAGAGKLDNGSLFTIGQPLIGTSSVPGRTGVSIGLLPALSPTNSILDQFHGISGITFDPAGKGIMISVTNVISRAGLSYTLQATTDFKTRETVGRAAPQGASLILHHTPDLGRFEYRFFRIQRND